MDGFVSSSGFGSMYTLLDRQTDSQTDKHTNEKQTDKNAEVQIRSTAN